MAERALKPDEIDAVLDVMRRGYTFVLGGSRCHTTYLCRDGAWRYEDFDEGYTEEHETTEADIRRLVAENPGATRPLLSLLPMAACGEAWRRGDRAAARAHLRAAAVHGDPLDHAAVLDAVLGWPEEPPSAETRALIVDKVTGHTAYHVFMDVMQWQRTAETGRLGVAFMDVIEAMVGDLRRLRGQRAAFREMAGDLAGALADLEVELARTASDDVNRTYLERHAAKLRVQLGLVEPE